MTKRANGGRVALVATALPRMAGAAILLLALVVGVPYLLITYVGNPLPTVVPSFDDVRYAVTNGQLDDWTWVKIFACLVWVAWTHLMASLVVEVVAAIRGAAASAVRGLGASQWAARRLVAQFTLLSTLVVHTATSAGGALPPLPSLDPVVAEVVDLGVAIPAVETIGAEDAAGSVGATIEVQPRETLWDLAQLHLGQGERWTEIRDANLGRTMPDGTVIDETLVNLRAGWELVMPGLTVSDAAAEAADGQVEGADGSVDAGEIVGTWRVAEGDHFWRIAETTLSSAWGREPTEAEIRRYWTELVEANRHHLISPGGKADLIYPEQEFDVLMPAVPGSGATDNAEQADEDGETAAAVMAERLESIEQFEPAAPRPPEPPVAPVRPAEPAPVAEAPAPAAAETPAPAEREEVDQARSDRVAAAMSGHAGPSGAETPPPAPTDTTRSLGLAAIGSGTLLVGAGLLGSLRRARRLRLAEVGAGMVPAPPPIDLADIETVLRNRSDGTSTRTLAAAVASLGHGIEQPDEPVAIPLAVRATSDRLEAILAGDADHPGPALPWQVAPVGGHGGRLAPGCVAVTAPLDRLPTPSGTAPVELPAPTLVTVGAGLLLNLEALGVVSLDGPDTQVGTLARSIVHELVGYSEDVHRAGPIEVWVSDRLAAIDVHRAVHHGPAEAFADRLAPWVDRVELGLAATGATSAWAQRLAGASPNDPGAMVVMADGADDTDGPAVADLAELARSRRLPLAVVLVGDPRRSSIDPAATVRMADGRVTVDPIGLQATVDLLDGDLILGVEALIDHARRAPIVLRPEPAWVAIDPADEARIEAGSVGPVTGDPAQVPTEETPEHEIATELPDETEEEVTDRSDDQESGLLVRVLGPVEIEGGPELDEEQRSIVAFLTLAGPSTPAQIREAVWPGGVDDQRFAAAVAGLHDALGARFPQAGDGRHRVRSTISDLGSARRWIAQADALSGERARNVLQLALSDVRGRPFTGVEPRHWQWIEDHRLAIATQASSLLLDGCFDLCDRAYEADDIHLALWACEVGGRLDPLQETVVTRRVQLLGLLDRLDEAEEVVAGWELGYQAQAGRPAPRGPRLALGEQRQTSAMDEPARWADAEQAVPHVG